MPKSKKDKAPLTRCGGTMTESAYLAWIRGALRSRSLRWPPRTTALQRARRAYKGPNKRQLWEYGCAICNNWFNAKEVVVDHHPVAAGSILSVEDIGPFANNLYCEVENLRVLCKPCHDIHTLAEKLGMSFEDAKIEKEVIKIMKAPVRKLKAELTQRGYSTEDVSKEEGRRDCVRKEIQRNNPFS